MNRSANTFFTMLFVASFLPHSVFAVSGPRGQSSVPSKRTIVPLSKLTRPVTALSAVDSVTKGSSKMVYDPFSFAQGAQINSSNVNNIQGASTAQAGASAGSTVIRSFGLTGNNLVNVAKATSGACGDLATTLQTSAIASANTSTRGVASTKIVGAAGTLGNSSFSQNNTTIGATSTIGMVSGPANVIEFEGNLMNPNS